MDKRFWDDSVVIVRLGEVRALDGRCGEEILPGTLVTAAADLETGNGVIVRSNNANHVFTKAPEDKVRGLCVVLNAEEDELRHVTDRGKVGRKAVSDPFPAYEQVRAHVLKAGEEFTFIVDESVAGAVNVGDELAVGGDGKLVPASGGNEVATARATVVVGATGDARRIPCRWL